MPIPNGFLAGDELARPEPRYPLSASVCTTCWLTQLTRVIPSDLMFRNYLYIPSTSKTMARPGKSTCGSGSRDSSSSSDIIGGVGSGRCAKRSRGFGLGNALSVDDAWGISENLGLRIFW